MYDDVCSKVTEYGVLTLSKPAPPQVVRQSLSVLCATRERLRRMEAAARPPWRKRWRRSAS